MKCPGCDSNLTQCSCGDFVCFNCEEMWSHSYVLEYNKKGE